MIGCTAICHVGLPEPFVLSPQLPCVCADGKILILIGAQMDEENDDALDVEVSIYRRNAAMLGELRNAFRVSV